jgi:hypothetical protein
MVKFPRPWNQMDMFYLTSLNIFRELATLVKVFRAIFSSVRERLL